MAIHTSRRLFTIDEYEQMARAGIFRADDRLELIEGEIFAGSRFYSTAPAMHPGPKRRLKTSALWGWNQLVHLITIPRRTGDHRREDVQFLVCILPERQHIRPDTALRMPRH